MPFRPLLPIFALLPWLLASCDARLKLTLQEAELVALIQKIQVENARTRAAFRLLPCAIPYASGPHACYSANVKHGGLTIKEVNFRPQRGGNPMTELNGIGPGCISLDVIRKSFDGGSIANRCSHGVCRYYTVESASGRLAFRLPDTAQAQQCVSDVVLNAGP